jgi:hypothetical protein
MIFLPIPRLRPSAKFGEEDFGGLGANPSRKKSCRKNKK